MTKIPFSAGDDRRLPRRYEDGQAAGKGMQICCVELYK